MSANYPWSSYAQKYNIVIIPLKETSIRCSFCSLTLGAEITHTCTGIMRIGMYLCTIEGAYSRTQMGMISTISALQPNLSRESNYNPNVAYYFMGLKFVQRILRLGIGDLRASCPSREASSGLCCFQCIFGTPLILCSSCIDNIYFSFLFFFSFPFPFLINSFFLRYVNILKQILVNCPGSYLLR